MRRQEYDWERAWELTRNNYTYAGALEGDPEGYLDGFLEENWSEFFLTDVDVLESGDRLDLVGIPRPRYANYSEPEMAEELSNAFDSYLRDLHDAKDALLRAAKPRLNLTVDGDIPMLLTSLAGGERRRGDYISQLIREVYAGKREIEPNIQALRLEIMGLDGRLRTLERMVEELSRRGGS